MGLYLHFVYLSFFSFALSSCMSKGHEEERHNDFKVVVSDDVAVQKKSEQQVAERLFEQVDWRQAFRNFPEETKKSSK